MPLTPGPFDVFISYSRKDNQNGWVTALRDLIVANASVAGQPVRPFFDTDDIGGEQDWRDRILQGLRHSKVLLVCLSPNYFASGYCHREWRYFRERQGKRNLQGEGESIQALRLVEFAESDAPDPNWYASVRRGKTFDLSPWFAEGPQILKAPGAAQAEALEVMAALAKRIANARGNLAREYGNLYAANSRFVGRKAQLQTLHEAVGVGKLGVITALHGLGGIGKTELAIQYANEYARSFRGGIWWIDAAPFSSSKQQENSTHLLKHAIAHLADKLETTPPKLAHNPDAHFDYVIRTLRRDSEHQRLTDPDGTAQVLILLDNVDDPALLGANQRNLIGNCSWLSLLATTRNASEEWRSADDLKVITLDGLDPDDALALMREWQKGHVFRDNADEDAARSLVESLGYYTLAVEQAAIYVGLKPEISIAEFLARLRDKGLEQLDVLAEREPQLRSTIQHQGKQLRLVLEQTLPDIGTLARQVLSYAAMFDPDAIAKPWLETLIVQHHSDQLEHESFADAWRWLEHKRLVTETNVAEVWRMHRLVREYLGVGAGPANARFEALIECQATEPEIGGNSPTELWPLDVLVAWVKGAKKALKLWTKVRSFLAKAYLQVQKFSLGAQILEPTLLYLKALHLKDPDKPKRTRDYANALELSAFIQHGMGDLFSTKLLGQQVMALRENLVRSMPDVTRFAQELNQSAKYFDAIIAEANSYRAVAEEQFRQALPNFSSVAEDVLRATSRVNIDMSEASRALGLQLNEISSRVDPILKDYGKQHSELIASVGAGLTEFNIVQSATNSAYDEIRKQLSESAYINNLINVDSWRSFVSDRCLPMSAAEARAKRRKGKLEYAKFMRAGDRDCLESINDTFEQLRDERKYVSNEDRRIWRHVRKELMGESYG